MKTLYGNGDGEADLLVANYMGDTLSILFGNGDGAFLAADTIPTTDNPYAVVAGDFNGDGTTGFAVARATSMVIYDPMTCAP